jgi:hypothetical protein
MHGGRSATLVPLFAICEHHDICIEQSEHGTAFSCVVIREARPDDHRISLLTPCNYFGVGVV